MTGTPNDELRVPWAQDTELVAEDAGSMLQPPLHKKNLKSILRAAAVPMIGDTRPARLDATPEGTRPTVYE